MSTLVPFIVSCITLCSLVVTIVLFFGRIKWVQEQQEMGIKRLWQVVEDIKTSQLNDTKVVLARVDSMDKAIIGLTVNMGNVTDLLKEIRTELKELRQR